MRSWVLIGLGLAGCQPGGDDVAVDSDEGIPWPAADAWGGTTGPGAPKVSFTEDQLGVACAALPGDLARDSDHHDLVAMFDGYLVVPWAPEWGAQKLDLEACGITGTPTAEDPGDIAGCEGVFGGGLTIWDISDPCAPTKVGEGWSPWMRETHTLSFVTVDDRVYVTVDYLEIDGSGGVGFWDITDPTHPFWASQVKVPGHAYPDSYLRLTLSAMWQYPYVYASTAINGEGVIDATDPLHPEWIESVKFDGIHQSGRFFAWGNRGMSASAGVARTILVDLSDPLAMPPTFGGDFDIENTDGLASPYYFANLGSRYALFASSLGGGSGPIVYDIGDPADPHVIGAAPNALGEGAYIFQHNDKLFMGESNFATIYDFTDPTAPTSLSQVHMQGDFDFFTPIGSIAVGSVDEDAVPGEASVVFPWSAEPDATPPTPGMTSPLDHETGVTVAARIGVVFDEMIEPVSVFPGSFRVEADDGAHVEGVFSVQENVVDFSPSAPLLPGTTYTVTLPADGIVDLTGNAVATDLVFSFTTAP